jgi:hypothetical protein
MPNGMHPVAVLTIVAFLCTLPPTRWGLRLAAAIALIGTALISLTAATPWDEQGRFHGIQEMALAALGVAALTGAFLRLMLTAIRGNPVWGDADASGPLHWFDRALSILGGVLLGTVATLFLAVTMRGTSGGLATHLIVGATSLGFAVLALRLRGHLRAVVVTTALTLATMTILGGLTYPSLISARAEAVLPSLPRCLRAGNEQPTTDQMRLLTLPLAQPRMPSLILTVMADDGPRHFRWSYRSFGFRTYTSYPHGPCPAG